METLFAVVDRLKALFAVIPTAVSLEAWLAGPDPKRRTRLRRPAPTLAGSEGRKRSRTSSPRRRG